MIEGFDKEIDLLLRQTAQGETAFAPVNRQSNHLDADEIAAFFENALPEKARLNYVAHLADCDRCRKILSNLIALNSETQSEIIHAEEPQLLTAVPEIPWYRKLFAVPTLAYMMGGLILLFAGFGVFTILQNNSSDSQISQVSEKQTGGKGMSSDGETTTQEIYTNTTANMSASNRMSANMTANVANAAATNSAVANSNAASTLRREPMQNSTDDRKANDFSLTERKSAETGSSVSAGAPPPAAPPPPPVTAENENDKTLSAPKPSISSQDAAVSEKQESVPTEIQPAPMKMRKADRAELKRKTESSSDSTTVGGKTFKRANNIWVDAVYRGQSTINISRGTNEYKNLDSGLRGTVENLGGTVVIVWRERAYRIQ